jgi:hypothetical protein
LWQKTLGKKRRGKEGKGSEAKLTIEASVLRRTCNSSTLKSAKTPQSKISQRTRKKSKIWRDTKISEMSEHGKPTRATTMAVQETLGFYPASSPLYAQDKSAEQTAVLRVNAAPRLASSGKEARYYTPELRLVWSGGPVSGGGSGLVLISALV